MKKIKLVALLGLGLSLGFVSSSYANPFNVGEKQQFIAQFYKVDYKPNTISKDGVYDNNSPLLKVDGVLTSEIDKEVNSGDKTNNLRILGKSFAFISSMNTVKIRDLHLTDPQLSETPDPNETIDTDFSPGIYTEWSGVDYKKNNDQVYDLDISKGDFMKDQDHSPESNKAIEEIFKYVDEIKLKKPLVHEDKIALKNIYLPVGKTLRHDFPPYLDKGKKYQQVVLVSFH